MASARVDIQDLARALAPLSLPPDRLQATVAALARLAPKALRLNRLAGVEPVSLRFPVEPVPWLPNWGYWPVGDVQPGRRIAYGAGLYYIQDAGSLLAVALLDARPGEVICDLCAAPGGKATAILEALGPAGGLLVNETIRSRIEPIRLNLARQGASRFVTTSLDPQDLAALMPAGFDAVLADVPCSGQSLVGAGKQRLSCFDPKMVNLNAARQRRILAAAAALLKPGGRLVYSTCTFSWAENEGQVRQFLADHPDLSLSSDPRLAAWQSPDPAPQGCYRLWPDTDRVAGAFAARLVRGDGPTAHELPPPRQTRRPTARHRRPESAPEVSWQDWGEWRQEIRLVPTGPQQVAALPADLPPPLQSLVDQGRAVGLPDAAQRFGKTWQPAYALAMRRDGAFAPSQRLDLSDDQAKAYLRGQTVPAAITGWTVTTWRGRPLGWGHATGRTVNNKLDKAARVRMP